jgi:hypothetical protein
MVRLHSAAWCKDPANAGFLRSRDGSFRARRCWRWCLNCASNLVPGIGNAADHPAPPPTRKSQASIWRPHHPNTEPARVSSDRTRRLLDADEATIGARSSPHDDRDPRLVGGFMDRQHPALADEARLGDAGDRSLIVGDRLADVAWKDGDLFTVRPAALVEATTVVLEDAHRAPGISRRLAGPAIPASNLDHKRMFAYLSNPGNRTR